MGTIVGLQLGCDLGSHKLIYRANEKGSLVYKIQKRFQKMFGFTLPLFYGRG
jgi:hypothetical protein